MKDQIKMFWDTLVHNKEPDDLNYNNQVLKDNPASIDSVPINKLVARDASKSNSFATATEAYLDQEGNAKKFEMAKKMLKEEIKSNEREVYNDLVSVKKDSRGSVRITKKG